MPNTKSAKKRLLTSKKQRFSNQTRKSRVKTARRKFVEAIDKGDAAAAEEALQVCFATLDRAANANAISKNKASRDKSRLTIRLAALKQEA